MSESIPSPDLREHLARIDHNQAEIQKHLAKANAFTPAPWAIVVASIIIALLIQFNQPLLAFVHTHGAP